MMKPTSGLLISMVIIASLSTLSEALLLNGLPINSLEVTGVLHCSLNGDLNASLLSGVTVHLVCDGSSTDIAQAVTDQAGAFTIKTGILGITNLNLQRCFVRINLPVTSCTLFPLSGVLTGSLSLLRVVQSTVGNVACVVLSGLIRFGPIG